MSAPQTDFVIVKSRAQYNAGYMPGFGNDFETEAIEGALPIGQNSPQRCPYGLYAKQLSGSPITALRISKSGGLAMATLNDTHGYNGRASTVVVSGGQFVIGDAQ